MSIRKPSGLGGQLTVWARFLVLCSPLPSSHARAPGEGRTPGAWGQVSQNTLDPGLPRALLRLKPRGFASPPPRPLFPVPGSGSGVCRVQAQEPLSQGSRGKERLEVRAARGERAAEAEGSGQMMRGQFNPLGK